MSIKNEVSDLYLNSMKAEHSRKPYPKSHRVLLTGDSKPGSIGQTIRETLDATIVSYHGDLRETVPNAGSFSMYTDLIMCHGATHLDWFEHAPLEKLKNLIDVNLYGSVNMVQAFVKATIDNPYRKSIISIGSMAYKAVLNGSAVYCASKAGLAHLMKCLAWELAPKGYDVYSVHPSNTEDTPMSKETIEGLMRYRGLNIKEATAYWNDSMIRRNSLSKMEIAILVDHLMRGVNPYLSGCNLELGGGQR